MNMTRRPWGGCCVEGRLTQGWGHGVPFAGGAGSGGPGSFGFAPDCVPGGPCVPGSPGQRVTPSASQAVHGVQFGFRALGARGTPTGMPRLSLL